jgi:hypothetical protein
LVLAELAAVQALESAQQLVRPRQGVDRLLVLGR